MAGGVGVLDLIGRLLCPRVKAGSRCCSDGGVVFVGLTFDGCLMYVAYVGGEGGSAAILRPLTIEYFLFFSLCGVVSQKRKRFGMSVPLGTPTE